MWKIIRHPLFLYVVFIYLLFALCSNFASAQSVIYRSYIESSCNYGNNPSCSPVVNAGLIQVAGPFDNYPSRRIRLCSESYNGYLFIGFTGSQCGYAASCPIGQSWRHDTSTFSCQPDNVETPQECGITGFPIWNGSGYTCEANFNTQCPEGTVNGNYTLPGYDPRPYCADGNPPASSSASSVASSSGQNSSSDNSDGEGDGGGSASSSSTGSGGGSSGSASSGQGGSASSSGGGGSGVGDCDPTANDYLSCIGDDLGEFPEHTESDSGATTFGEVNENFVDGLQGTELVQAFEGMKNFINVSSPSCPPFSMDLSGTPINRTISTTIHCELWNDVKNEISVVMMAAWTFLAFRIFASA